jgi:hypothetical protein
MDARTARYTLWQDLVITFWRLGPFAQLQVRDEVAVMFDMEVWERAHPAAMTQGEFGPAKTRQHIFISVERGPARLE